ncbi:MAG: zonular occludens toxin domain-containing protein [Planctomycetota bacterium]
MSKPLSTGIFGIVGVPGSGKSLSAVREIVRTVVNTRRPCYTNIPIRPKKLRAYIYRKLKRKKLPHEERRAVAQLVKPITKKHFQRFCERLETVNQVTNRLLEKSGLDSDSVGQLGEFAHMAFVKRALRIVARVMGPPRITGTDGDWVPPGSCLFLDELHKWYPSKDYRNEDPAIIALTSMHRHMQLKIFVLTQRWMNASLSFRSMAEEVWFCMNWAKKPIVGFLRISEVINVFRYVRFNGEDIEERGGMPGIGAKPIFSELYCPEWTGGAEYELYRSHSHAGTLEEQRQEMDGVVRAMMGDRRAVARETESEEDEDMRNKNSLSKRANRGFTWLCVCAFCFTIGRCTVDREIIVENVMAEAAVVQPQVPEPAAEREVEPLEPAEALAEEYLPPAWLGVRMGAVMPRGVMIEGESYKIGDRYEDLVLVGVDPDVGDSAWLRKDATSWRWRVGAAPVRGVLPAKIRAALRSVLAERMEAERAARVESAAAENGAP